MKLLVTGGAGYIGSNTALKLIEAGHQVVILDNFYSGRRDAIPEEATLIEGDVGSRELLDRIFHEHRFDGVLHFAAHIEVGESVVDPLKYYKNNTLASLTLIDAVRRAAIRNFIFSSTAAVYGEPAGSEPLSERASIQPMNPYGVSKAMTERILQDVALAASGEFSYVILRYFNAAGARRDLRAGQSTPRATHLIKVACEAALGVRKELKIFGDDYPTADGTCMRDYIHIEDLAQAHVDALSYLERRGESEIFNCGYGNPTSVLQVIESFKRVTGREFPVVKSARRPGDPSALSADNSKIRKVLGWKPQFNDIDLICQTAWEWEQRLYKDRKL